MNKLIIISAPSGAGKTTLVKILLEKFKNLEFSISCTTRQKRENETNNKDYYFISEQDFINKINNNDFIEYEQVYSGTFYGTLKSETTRIWQNKNTVIFDVDVIGGINLKKKFIENSLAIFIAPPDLETLEKRLLNRNTDSIQTIKTRLEKSKYEMNFSSEFDYILINDDLEKAKKEIIKKVDDFINN